MNSVKSPRVPLPVRRSGGAGLPLNSLPLEWLDGRSWRLPSGQALAEFALQAGFLAPLLLRRDPSRSKTQQSRTASMIATVPATVSSEDL